MAMMMDERARYKLISFIIFASSGFIVGLIVGLLIR